MKSSKPGFALQSVRQILQPPDHRRCRESLFFGDQHVMGGCDLLLLLLICLQMMLLIWASKGYAAASFALKSWFRPNSETNVYYLPPLPCACTRNGFPTFLQTFPRSWGGRVSSIHEQQHGTRDSAQCALSLADMQVQCPEDQGSTCTARAPRDVLEKTMGKRSFLVPWLLDAHVLPKLGGGDDGDRHPITI